MYTDDNHNHSVSEDLMSPDLHPDEQELLAKLEAANRLLLSDEKSCAALNSSPTPGHSRKGSGSSIQSSASYSSTYSAQQPEEDSALTASNLWDVWGKLVNDWETAKKKPAVIKELVRKGIPHHFRGLAWQLILNVHDSPHKEEYVEYLKKSSPSEKLIRRDIARTFPEQEFFKEKDGLGQESLFNVMKAYSLHDREVGYCQGSGFIVGLLLMQMPEEEAFAVLVKLMQDYRLRELFKPSMAELGLCMYKLEWLLQEIVPDLFLHFQTQGFHTSMYASSWFLTLFSTSFPLSIACRIMDLFISEGMDIIFRVGVAILQTSQEELMSLDMEGMLKFFQKEMPSKYECDPEKLFSAACSVRYSAKKLKKALCLINSSAPSPLLAPFRGGGIEYLNDSDSYAGEGLMPLAGPPKSDRIEKDYTALKSKENEDQIELRRLRTENRLLRQRIDTLEKESANLADKLIHDQVTRAQEAEETYALKNTLSTTKQKLADTQRKLEESQVLIGDIKERTLSIASASSLDEGEAQTVIQGLQEELIALRLKDADTDSLVKELRVKIKELNDTNTRLQKAPSNDVQHLQEELIAVKLREAEANLSLKEMRQRVHELESLWEKHIERMNRDNPSPKEKSTKTDIKHLQEELMTVKIREANCLSDLKEAKQKVMELETQNHICTNQIRRMDDENKTLKSTSSEKEKVEKDLNHQIKQLHRKMDDLHTQRKEESMMVRIKEAEHAQHVAELKQRIAELEIQREELLTADQLDATDGAQDLENRIYDLQDEVLHLKLLQKPPELDGAITGKNGFCLGEDDDDEIDVELENPESLNRTLSKIIEGPDENLSITTMQSVGDVHSKSPNICDVDDDEISNNCVKNEILSTESDCAKGDNSIRNYSSERCKCLETLHRDSGANISTYRGANDIIDVEIYKESKV